MQSPGGWSTVSEQVRCEVRSVQDLVGHKGEEGLYFNGKPLEDLQEKSDVDLISLFSSLL